MKLKHLALYGGTILVSGGCAAERIAAPAAVSAAPDVVSEAPASATIRSTAPLYVKDPMLIVDGEVIGTADGLDPSDIVSIAVVARQVASGIYGSAGSNGVILITTHRAPVAAPAPEVSRRMLVLVNGATSSAGALRRIPADRVVDIQVLRGSRDGLMRFFGAEAGEGVVVVRTRGD